jgi:2-octaprenyl-6-methoxyphenol hydroxylase
MSESAIEPDVLIVGGGLVGSLLANALRQLRLRVTMIEAREPRRLEQPSFDGRATALANGSRRVLEGLGLWPAVRRSAEPIASIHIGERGRFGAARILAAEEDVEALGYTVENRVLGDALWTPLLEDPGFTCLAPAELVDFSADAEGVEALARDAAGETRVRARLLVAADGARSTVRRALGIGSREDDYGQAAVIVNIATELPHAGRAFERFTANGPIAFLPLTEDRVAVVWTLASPAAADVMALDDAAFRDALQAAFGYRLGRIERVGRRAMHPLWRLRSEELTRERTVLIGNAAISLHPVAGQGFNLALRDTATLAEVMADEMAARGASADIGSDPVLRRYREWRRDDQRKVAGFTHGLVRLFGQSLPGLGTLRGFGLVAFDLLPGAKSALARHTMGMAGRLPRLARHLKLME